MECKPSTLRGNIPTVHLLGLNRVSVDKRHMLGETSTGNNLVLCGLWWESAQGGKEYYREHSVPVSSFV